MNNQDAGSFLLLLKEVLKHSSASEEKLNHFFSSIERSDYSAISHEEAADITSYLEEAGDNLDKMVLESRDIEKINNLTSLKEFVNGLLNDSEKQALEFVLNSSGSSVNSGSATSKRDGKWLMDKLAGLVDDES